MFTMQLTRLVRISVEQIVAMRTFSAAAQEAVVASKGLNVASSPTNASASEGSPHGGSDRLVTKQPSTSRSGYTETVAPGSRPNELHGLKVKLSSKETTRKLSNADAWVMDNLVGCLTKVRTEPLSEPKSYSLRGHFHLSCTLLPYTYYLPHLTAQEGKKATAQRIVLDAMEIIRTELAQSAATAAAESAAKSAKATEAAEKAAASAAGRRSRKQDASAPAAPPS